MPSKSTKKPPESNKKSQKMKPARPAESPPKSQQAKPARQDGSPPPQQKRRNLTDLGNAERLMDHYGTEMRYCHPMSKWYLWHKNHWRQDNLGQATHWGSIVARKIYAEAAEETDRDTQNELLAFAKRSEGAGAIRNMLQLAQSLRPVMPNEMDRDSWVFNVENCTIDLRTGKDRPHRREDLITKLAPVTFDPKAKCPRWNAFLLQIMDGKEYLVSYLRRLTGYMLTGDVSEQVIHFFHGEGANGKSTLINTLLTMFGDYGMQAAPELLLARKYEAHPTEQADLFGCRLAVCTEVAQGRNLNEVATKHLTGGDRIKARRMREDFWEFEPTHKLIVAINDMPKIEAVDHGIWRRVRVVPFKVTIPKYKQDPHLGEKLKEELPGILAWAVRGCREWQREGLRPPPEVLEATDQYREHMDVVGHFIAARCILDSAAKVATADLYASYLDWCGKNHEEPLNKVDFAARLTERGLNPAKGSKGVRMWRGVELKQRPSVGGVGGAISH